MVLEKCILAYILAVNQALSAGAFLIPIEMVLDNKKELDSLSPSKAMAWTNNGVDEESFNDKMTFKDDYDTMRGIPVFLNILSMSKPREYIHNIIQYEYCIKINFSFSNFKFFFR